MIKIKRTGGPVTHIVPSRVVGIEEREVREGEVSYTLVYDIGEGDRVMRWGIDEESAREVMAAVGPHRLEARVNQESASGGARTPATKPDPSTSAKA